MLKKIITTLPNNTELYFPVIKNKILEIPASLLKVENGFVTLEIRNLLDHSILIAFSPHDIESKCTPFFEEEHELFNIEQISEINYYQTIEKTETNEFSLIRSDHLNEEEKNNLKLLLAKFPNIFHKPNDKLTFTNQIKHKIETSDEIPVHAKSYRYPYIHKQEVQRQIDQMLTDGIIRPSSSPWSSPVWIVPKKIDASGKQKWRIVIDYRKVNEKTIDDRYPLPNINDILDKLGRCQYFTTLDLASGFHQIEMDPSSIQKTAFNVENGHYEYLRMPFGLKNAPATFQRVMDNVLRGLQGKICLVYMDDIIIFSTSLQEHISNLKLVFERLQDNNLKIQLDKSEFLKKNVEFLGHVITPEGIKPNPKKIETILNFPIPKNPKEIKSFLGLVGYYRKFIKNFAKLTKPLTQCLKKNVKVEHTPEFINSFEKCKITLTNDPILQHPDFSKPFILTTDASNFAIGAILSQGTIGQDLPIAYASRTLNPAECNYSTIEKELLAIVWATKYFRPYLFGKKFKIVSDHKPLQWLFSIKEPHSKLVRWRLKLSEYDYEIVYKKGKNNTNADALSRIPIQINAIEDDQVSIIPQLDPSETIPQISNEELDDILNNLNPNQPQNKKINVISNTLIKPPRKTESDNQTIHTSQENPVVGAPYVNKCLNVYKNQIIFRYSSDNKTKIEKQQIFDKTRKIIFLPNNPAEETLCQTIKEQFIPGKTYCLLFKNLTLEPIILRIFQNYFKNGAFNLFITRTFLEDIIDKDEQQLKIKYYHETKTTHRGIKENIISLKKHFYWPNLENDVKTYINLCEICQTVKYERHPNKIVFKPTPIGHEPFDHIYIDIYKTHNTSFLTVLDSFSKLGQAYPLMTHNGPEVIENLLKYFNHYGLPRKITTDNDTSFKNENVQKFCMLHNIEMHYCTPHNPNSNSFVERFHSTLNEIILSLQNEKPKENIINLMNYALLSYNNSTHNALKYTPFQVIKGKLDYKNPLELNEEEKLTHFIQEHSERIKTMKNLLYEQLIENQKLTLDKRNKNRDDEIKIDTSKPIFEKKFPIKSKKKQSNRYKKLEVPIKALPTKIIAKKRMIHLHNLKPQRIVSDRNDSTSPPAGTAKYSMVLRSKGTD